MSSTIKRLNRFTQLPFLLDYLERKRLVLLDPSNWDDKNDSLIIEEYKARAKVEKLLALCFTHNYETIHHWKTFADGPSGCCIEFDGQALQNIFDKKKLRHKAIDYQKISDTNPGKIVLAEIPFIKRVPYQPEHEYRVIWEGKNRDYFEIYVPLKYIKRITFSQQMHESVFETLKTMLIHRYPVLAKRIYRSTIYKNNTWIKKFKA